MLAEVGTSQHFPPRKAMNAWEMVANGKNKNSICAVQTTHPWGNHSSLRLSRFTFPYSTYMNTNILYVWTWENSRASVDYVEIQETVKLLPWSTHLRYIMRWHSQLTCFHHAPALLLLSFFFRLYKPWPPAPLAYREPQAAILFLHLCLLELRISLRGNPLRKDWQHRDKTNTLM